MLTLGHHSGIPGQSPVLSNRSTLPSVNFWLARTSIFYSRKMCLNVKFDIANESEQSERVD